MPGRYWFGSAALAFTLATTWAWVKISPFSLSLMAWLNSSLPVITGGRLAFTLPSSMKDKIHPKYYTDATVTCSCGNTFTIGSTRKTLKVELCSKCHPFFTGERRMVDTAGRVERFKRRYKLEG